METIHIGSLKAGHGRLYDDGGALSDDVLFHGSLNVFSHPERFVPYDGGFLYPPRIERKITPEYLKTLEVNKLLGQPFHESEYIGQPKLNGSSTSVAISKDKVVAKERHNTFFAIQPTFDFKALHRGTGFMCLTGEFMNKSKADEAGAPFRGFCIWGITAYDGKVLLGSTVEERVNLLNQLYPITGEVTTIDGLTYLYETGVKDIYRCVNFTEDFTQIYNDISKIDMVEGFCLKRKNGKLEPLTREKNNEGWSMKCRKPTSNYKF